MTTNLYAALVHAQAAVRPVEKDSTNSFHKYKYASGDDVIASARAALNANGLAAFATRWQVTETPFQWEDEKGAKHDDVSIRLSVHFRLVHESGETLDFDPFGVPVLPEKGRPIDKAEAGARTYALSYFLRDLLLIPRVDEGADVDQRDDRDRAPRGARPSPRTAPDPSPPAPADPHRADAEAALAKTLADFPAHEAAIRARYAEARSGEEALTFMRRKYAALAAEAKTQKPLAQRTQAEQGLVKRVRDTLAVLDREKLAEAAQQARALVDEYGGLDHVSSADLPALVSQVCGLADAALAAKVAA